VNPFDVDKLGQKDGENYFAIVHVDGNNMGVKFRTCKNLVERRRLSSEIRRKTEGAFADLLAKIIRMKNSGGFDDALKLDKNFLPIRPLIIGGDDVTFLCPANMAILFTKTLIENLFAATPADAPEHLTQKISRHMDSCAGIAILPTKYPFFRGYKLAEQLCDSAKAAMRKLANDDLRGSSWLDFAILHGEQAPTLEQIRAKKYRGALGDLHFGSYRLCNDDAAYKRDRQHNLENLLYNAAKTMRGNFCGNCIIRNELCRRCPIGTTSRKHCGTVARRHTSTRKLFTTRSDCRTSPPKDSKVCFTRARSKFGRCLN